jgi:uracil-DNA glycosylase
VLHLQEEQILKVSKSFSEELEAVVKISDHVRCIDFPCVEARQESYLVPDLELDPRTIKIMLISETAATNLMDNYYFTCDALYARTTLLAFKEAGVQVSNVLELLRMGIYLTTAVKCGKNDYAVANSTIGHCSSLLELEIDLFPNIKAFLLMGDVAIKTLNTIAKRQGEPRVIPAGSTYKIRSGQFNYRGARAFPSYLQAGPSFGIEKSKVRMIAEDIASSMRVAGIK